MSNMMNMTGSVRQVEQIGVWSEHVDTSSQAEGAAPSALISLIAASIRRERDRAGLSLTELARRAGLAKSPLAQLEFGGGNPSVEPLWALGVALGVPFSRLVDQPRPTVRVIRAGEGPVTYAERANYAATLLASCPPNARRDIYRIQVQPGEPRLSDPHNPGATEHVVLSTGPPQVRPPLDPADPRPAHSIAHP